MKDNSRFLQLIRTKRKSIFTITVLIILVIYFLPHYLLKSEETTVSNNSTNNISKATNIDGLVDKKHEDTRITQLKSFIADGKKKGYFPSKVLSEDDDNPRFIDVNIDFNPVVQWTKNSQCLDHSDQTILTSGNKNQYVECGYNDTVIILGSGNDWVSNAWGNSIILPNGGNDTISLGGKSNIVIFDKNWGNDTVKIESERIDKEKVIGEVGFYPWEFTSFIIFADGVNREDIVWKGNTLVNTATGDTVSLNTKNVNVLFASSPNVFKSIPEIQQPEKIDLGKLYPEDVFVEDNIVYYANGNDGLYIVDMANPNDPILLSKTVFQGKALSVNLHKNIAYVTQSDLKGVNKRGWVTLVDVSNKQNPKIITTLSFGSGINGIDVTDKYLYIIETPLFLYRDRAKLNIFDNTDPYNPMLISKTKMESIARRVTYMDDTLFLSREEYGVQVFDVKNPQFPVQTSEYSLPGSWLSSIKIFGKKIVADLDENFVVLIPKSGKKLNIWCEIPATKNDKNNRIMNNHSIWIKGDKIYKINRKNGVDIITIDNSGECRVINSIPLKKQDINLLYVVENTLVAHSNKNGYETYCLKDNCIEKREEKSNDLNDEINKSAYKSDDYEQNYELSDEQVQYLLYKAASAGNVEKINELCQKGGNPNDVGHQNYSPIDIIIRGRYSPFDAVGKDKNPKSIKALRTLLNCSGTKPTEESIILAASHNDFEALKIFQEYGGNIAKAKSEDGCTALHYMAVKGNVEAVKYLIAKGIPVNATCMKGQTPLMWAEKNGKTAVVDYFKSLE